MVKFLFLIYFLAPGPFCLFLIRFLAPGPFSFFKASSLSGAGPFFLFQSFFAFWRRAVSFSCSGGGNKLGPFFFCGSFYCGRVIKMKKARKKHSLFSVGQKKKGGSPPPLKVSFISWAGAIFSGANLR